MKHAEVKLLQRQLVQLLNHITEKKSDIFHVNYGLDKNYTRITSAIQELDKHTSKELIEIEKEALDIAQKEEIGVEEAISKLEQEKQDRHKELMIEYNEAMLEENDFQIFYLDPNKCNDLKIDFEFLQILKKFFPKD